MFLKIILHTKININLPIISLLPGGEGAEAEAAGGSG